MQTEAIRISILGLLAASAPLSLFAQAQPRFVVTDLGPATTGFSQATGVNNFGLAVGFDSAEDGTFHAILWDHGLLLDITQPGLGGVNSIAGLVNDFGEVLGQAETKTKDPNGENFCGFGTGQQCQAWVYRYGIMTALPTLKGADGKPGTNSGFGNINNMGAVAGYAENSNKDPECPGKPLPNGTGPQVLDFEPVIWGPKAGEMRQLALLPGDSVGMAFQINDLGETVGGSGRCGNSVLPGFAATPHAVLWDPNGTPHDLGNLGGSSDPTVLGSGTFAFGINNAAQVTGVAALKGNQTFHPFRWTQATGMRDLGVLKGDLVGAGLAINNRGQIVGASISAPGPESGNPRAFLWEGNVMYDLNALVQLDAPLYLLTACSVSDDGKIVGFGATDEGEIHAFLAEPNPGLGASAGLSPDFMKKPPQISNEARRFVLRHIHGR